MKNENEGSSHQIGRGTVPWKTEASKRLLYPAPNQAIDPDAQRPHRLIFPLISLSTFTSATVSGWFHKLSPASSLIPSNGFLGIPPYPYSFSRRYFVPAMEAFAMVKSARAIMPCRICASGRNDGSLTACVLNWKSLFMAC